MTAKLVRLGVFATVTIALAVYIGAQIANVNVQGTYPLRATFTDVTGLGSGDPVRLAGVPVGKVTSVMLVGGRAQVGFQVGTNAHVPVDTTVAVRWRNLIGQRYLSLVPGQSTKMLAPNSQITRTTSVIDLGAFVNELGPLAAELNPQELNQIFTALSQALDGNQQNVISLVGNLNSVLSTLAGRNATLSQLLTDYKTITGTLATRDQQIETMVNNLVLLSQSFNDNTGLVDNALTQLSGLSTGLNQLLTVSGTQLQGVVGNLAVLTGVLHARIADLEATLHSLPTALQALFSTTARGSYLSIDLVCLSFSPNCPYPIVRAQAIPRASGSVGLPLDSTTAFRQLLVGGS
jgi:phospholipid/cholesterol/gamma-HCH transport system substrate-binding protein